MGHTLEYTPTNLWVTTLPLLLPPLNQVSAVTGSVRGSRGDTENVGGGGSQSSLDAVDVTRHSLGSHSQNDIGGMSAVGNQRARLEVTRHSLGNRSLNWWFDFRWRSKGNSGVGE